jgi:hypothetical protein
MTGGYYDPDAGSSAQTTTTTSDDSADGFVQVPDSGDEP